MNDTELTQKLRQYEMREALIQRIHPEINDVIDIDRFLAATVYELGRVLQVDRCDFLLPYPEPSDDGMALQVEYEYQRDTQVPSLIKSTFPLEPEAQTGMWGTFVAHDVSESQLPSALAAECEAVGTASFLGIPLRFRRELLGLLGLHYCERSHRWSRDEVELLESLAQYLTIGLQYTRLYVQMEKEMEITKALLSIAREIHAKRDFAQITSFILAKAVELLKADYGCIGIPDASGEELHLTALYPEVTALSDLDLPDAIRMADVPLLKEILQGQQSVCVRDLPREAPKFSALVQGQVAMLVPIVVGQRSYGLLNLVWTGQRNGFAPHEVELVNGIASQMALVIEKNQLSAEVLRLKGELSRSRSVMIVGASAAIEKSINRALHVAESDTTVLLKGETGTGKELIADLIQKSSPRKDAPYIKINCGAIPETLLESELFGYEKGAFTDAKTQRIGKFESVDGGTIFLDEVGELIPSAQTKLLRVLEQGELYRVGGVRPVQVDVRVVAATNMDLEAAIAEGRFRKDLYYRLNVYPISLPPLRERREDILLLAHHFLEIYKKKANKAIIGISEEAMRLLQRHDWPGNVRELENAIERAVIDCHGIVLTVEQLPEVVSQLDDATDHADDTAEALSDEGDRLLIEIGSSMAQIERCAIEETLKHTGGDKKRAAGILGISRKTLYRKLEKYSL